jgi:hypothetical protein
MLYKVYDQLLKTYICFPQKLFSNSLYVDVGFYQEN